MAKNSSFVLKDRQLIERGLKEGKRRSEMADSLGIPLERLHGEIKRNGGTHFYSAEAAQKREDRIVALYKARGESRITPFRITTSRLAFLKEYCLKNKTSIQKLLEGYVDSLINSTTCASS
jgi:IS30 family transposase